MPQASAITDCATGGLGIEANETMSPNKVFLPVNGILLVPFPTHGKPNNMSRLGNHSC